MRDYLNQDIDDFNVVGQAHMAHFLKLPPIWDMDIKVSRYSLHKIHKIYPAIQIPLHMYKYTIDLIYNIYMTWISEMKLYLYQFMYNLPKMFMLCNTARDLRIKINYSSAPTYNEHIDIVRHKPKMCGFRKIVKNFN